MSNSTFTTQATEPVTKTVRHIGAHKSTHNAYEHMSKSAETSLEPEYQSSN